MGIAYSKKPENANEHEVSKTKNLAPDLSKYKNLPAFQCYATLPVSAISHAYGEFRRGMFPSALNRGQFERIVNITSKDILFPDIVDQFDHFKSRTGKVSALDFFAGITLTCRDSLNMKLRFLFRLFDAKQIKALNYDEVVLLLSCTMRGYCTIKRAPAPTMMGIERVADEVFGRAIDKATGRVSLAEFTRWCKQAGPLLFLLEGLNSSSTKRHELVDLKTHEQKSLLQQLAKIEAALHTHTLVPLNPEEYRYNTGGAETQATSGNQEFGGKLENSADLRGGQKGVVWLGIGEGADVDFSAFPVSDMLSRMMALYLEIPNNLEEIPYHPAPTAIFGEHLMNFRHELTMSLEDLEAISEELKFSVSASHQHIDSFWEATKNCFPCTVEYFGYKLNLEGNWSNDARKRFPNSKDIDLETEDERQSKKVGHSCNIATYLHWVKEVETVIAKAKGKRLAASSDSAVTGSMECLSFEAKVVTSVLRWMLAEETSRLQFGAALVRRTWDESIQSGSPVEVEMILKGLCQGDLSSTPTLASNESVSKAMSCSKTFEATIGPGAHKSKQFVNPDLAQLQLLILATVMNHDHSMDGNKLGQVVQEAHLLAPEIGEPETDSEGGGSEEEENHSDNSSQSSSSDESDNVSIDMTLLVAGEELYSILVEQGNWEVAEECGGYFSVAFTLIKGTKKSVVKGTVEQVKHAFSEPSAAMVLSEYLVGVHCNPIHGHEGSQLHIHFFMSTEVVCMMNQLIFMSSCFREMFTQFGEARVKVNFVNDSLNQCGDDSFRDMMLWNDQPDNVRRNKRQSTNKLDSKTSSRRRGLAVTSNVPVRNTRRVSSIIAPSAVPGIGSPSLMKKKKKEFGVRVGSKPAKLTDLGEKIVNRIFDQFDVNQDGVLDLFEINMMQRMLGGEGFPSQREYHDLLKEQNIITNENGDLVREGFTGLYLSSDPNCLMEDLWLLGFRRFRGHLQYCISAEIDSHPLNHVINWDGGEQGSPCNAESNSESEKTAIVQLDASCLAECYGSNRKSCALALPGVLALQFRVLCNILRLCFEWQQGLPVGTHFHQSNSDERREVDEKIAIIRLLSKLCDGLQFLIDDLKVVRYSTSTGIFVEVCFDGLDILKTALFS